MMLIVGSLRSVESAFSSFQLLWLDIHTEGRSFNSDWLVNCFILGCP